MPSVKIEIEVDVNWRKRSTPQRISGVQGTNLDKKNVKSV